MIRISYLMRRLPGLSLEEIQTYWSEKHPTAAPQDAFSVLGVKRYMQVLPMNTDTRDLVVGPRTGLEEPYDGMAELWVEDTETLRANWSTEKAKEYVKIFYKDEQNFIDWSRSTILVSNEINVFG